MLQVVWFKRDLRLEDHAALRRKPESRAEAKAVVQNHGSRKGSRQRLTAMTKKAVADQLDLGL